MSLALLDGDIIAYRAATAAQKDYDWGDGQTGMTVDVKAAIYNAQSLVRTWTEKAGADRAVICLSPPDGSNFRRSICSTYKAERGSKPEAYVEVVRALSVDHDCQFVYNLEADDLMGIMSTSPKFKNPVIVSIDKDMKTIPGLLLNPLKDTKPRRIREAEADRSWMKQTLMGDRIDGYTGLFGVGPVKAERILEGARSLQQMWKLVVIEYEARGFTEADALLNARMSRILRREDYDKEKETVFLWHPDQNKREAFSLAEAGR